MPGGLAHTITALLLFFLVVYGASGAMVIQLDPAESIYSLNSTSDSQSDVELGGQWGRTCWANAITGASTVCGFSYDLYLSTDVVPLKKRGDLALALARESAEGPSWDAYWDESDMWAFVIDEWSGQVLAHQPINPATVPKTVLAEPDGGPNTLGPLERWSIAFDSPPVDLDPAATYYLALCNAGWTQAYTLLGHAVSAGQDPSAVRACSDGCPNGEWSMSEAQYSLATTITYNQQCEAPLPSESASPSPSPSASSPSPLVSPSPSPSASPAAPLRVINLDPPSTVYTLNATKASYGGSDAADSMLGTAWGRRCWANAVTGASAVCGFTTDIMLLATDADLNPAGPGSAWSAYWAQSDMWAFVLDESAQIVAHQPIDPETVQKELLGGQYAAGPLERWTIAFDEVPALNRESVYYLALCSNAGPVGYDLSVHKGPLNAVRSCTDGCEDMANWNGHQFSTYSLATTINYDVCPDPSPSPSPTPSASASPSPSPSASPSPSPSSAPYEPPTYSNAIPLDPPGPNITVPSTPGVETDLPLARGFMGRLCYANAITHATTVCGFSYDLYRSPVLAPMKKRGFPSEGEGEGSSWDAYWDESDMWAFVIDEWSGQVLAHQPINPATVPKTVLAEYDGGPNMLGPLERWSIAFDSPPLELDPAATYYLALCSNAMEQAYTLLAHEATSPEEPLAQRSCQWDCGSAYNWYQDEAPYASYATTITYGQCAASPSPSPSPSPSTLPLPSPSSSPSPTASASPAVVVVDKPSEGGVGGGTIIGAAIGGAAGAAGGAVVLLAAGYLIYRWINRSQAPIEIVSALDTSKATAIGDNALFQDTNVMRPNGLYESV